MVRFLVSINIICFSLFLVIMWKEATNKVHLLRKKMREYWESYLFDFVCVFILTTTFSLEITHCVSFSDSFVNNVPVNIIISLIPAIITVISLLPQLQNEKIYGLRLRELLQLRKGPYFTLLHMLLISIGIFCFEFLFSITSSILSLIILNCISVIYSIWFILIIIPLLTKNVTAVKRIVKNFEYNTEKDFKKDSSYQNINKMLFSLINEIGFENTFSLVKSNDADRNIIVVDYLLNLVVSENNNLLNIINAIPNNSYDHDIFTNSYKLVEKSFKLLEDILQGDCLPQYEKHLLNSNLLRRLTYVLYKISSFYNGGVFDYKGRMKTALLKYFIYKDGRTKYYNFLLVSCSYYLQNGETWFAECFRDNDWQFLFFDPNEDAVNYFIVFYSYFLLSSKYVSDDNKCKIKTFLNSNSQCINSDKKSWMLKFSNSVDNYNDYALLFHLIKNILGLFENVETVYLNTHPVGVGVYSADDNVYFSKKLVVDYILQLLAKHPFVDLSKEEVMKGLDDLPDDYKIIVKECVEERWIHRKEGTYGFYSFYFDKYDLSHENKQVLAALIEFKDAFNKKADKIVGNPNEICKKIKKIMDEKVPIILTKNNIKDTICGVNYYETATGTVILQGDELESIMESYLDKLPYMLDDYLSSIVFKKVTPTVEKGENKYFYDSRTIKAIIDFKPKYARNTYILMASTNDEHFRKAIKDLKIISKECLPDNVYIKEKGISISNHYSSFESKAEPLNDRELDDIIDNDYVLENGLYRYTKYKGLEKGSYLVNRDELVTILRTRTVKVTIVIDIVLSIDSEKVFSVKEGKDGTNIVNPNNV